MNLHVDLRSYVVQVENFSLVGKRSTTGSSTTRTNAVSFAQLVQMSACTNAVKLQMSLTRGFICSICSKTQIIPAINNDPRKVKSHCSDFLPF